VTGFSRIRRVTLGVANGYTPVVRPGRSNSNAAPASANYRNLTAKRWGWITINPLDAAQRPRIPQPQPDPPSTEEAAKIANAAWAQDSDWGTFVWLTFVTGARRGELVGLAWEHADLVSGLLTIRRSLVRRNGTTILKDTKTHQMRVIKLDQDTITILSQHKARAEQRCDR
jgi:integrase